MTKMYQWKCRLLLIKTPNFKHPGYKLTKNIFQKNIKSFHKRVIKLITKLDKSKSFSIELIGFDGKKKAEFKKINCREIFRLVDGMPISRLNKKKIKPINLSLFSDYNPKTTTQGLGYKNKDNAVHTIKKIKNRSLRYQVNVISTMLGRAKKHPNKTPEMDDAIGLFNEWMTNYKKNKS